MQAVTNQPVCPVYLIVHQPPATAVTDASVSVVYQTTSSERPTDQWMAPASVNAETQCTQEEFVVQAPAAPQASCQPLSLRVTLNDIEVIAIVDIGSAISLIDQRFVQQNPSVADNNNQWVPDFLATTCEVQQHTGFTGYIYTALAIGSRAAQPIVLDFVRSQAFIADVKVPLLNEFEPGLAIFAASLKDATVFQAKQEIIASATIERLFDVTIQERLSDMLTTNGYGFFEGMSAFENHHPINALSALVPSSESEILVRLINTADFVVRLPSGLHLGTFTATKFQAIAAPQSATESEVVATSPEAPCVSHSPADTSRKPDGAKARERLPSCDWSLGVQSRQPVNSNASSVQTLGNCTAAESACSSPPLQQSNPAVSAQQLKSDRAPEQQDDLLKCLAELSDCLASYHQQTSQQGKHEATSVSLSVSKAMRQQSQRVNYCRAEARQQAPQQGNFAIECLNVAVIVLALVLLFVSQSSVSALQGPSTTVACTHPRACGITVVPPRSPHVSMCAAFIEQLTAPSVHQQRQHGRFSPSHQPGSIAQTTAAKRETSALRPAVRATVRSEAAATESKSQPTGATSAAACEMPPKHQPMTQGTASHPPALGSTAVQQTTTPQTTDNATPVHLRSTTMSNNAREQATRTPCQSTTRDSAEQPQEGQPTTSRLVRHLTASLSTDRSTIRGQPLERAASAINCATRFSATSSLSGLAIGPPYCATTSTVESSSGQAANRREPIERVRYSNQQAKMVTQAANGNDNAEGAGNQPGARVKGPRSTGLCRSCQRQRPASHQANQQQASAKDVFAATPAASRPKPGALRLIQAPPPPMPSRYRYADKEAHTLHTCRQQPLAPGSPVIRLQAAKQATDALRD